MSSEFKPIPTSLGGLLGGAGGYALAHFTDMDAKGKALMSAAGAALGGGLGYAGSKDIDTVDTTKAEIAEARDILRRRNRLSRLGAAMLAGGLGSGATGLFAPRIADRHHREYLEALAKPHKEWNAQVMGLANKKLNDYYATATEAALRNGTTFTPTTTLLGRYRDMRLHGFIDQARGELVASKPSAAKVSRLVRTLRRRRGLYTALGLGATLGAAGLANWLTKDPSLD